ncbi:MAG: pyridine nucleotide-disulfide oxidoreductase, partial [Gammaproteobacteria bacterium]|nr:pyridine nucleotide-disulfide oxidoreductase [Gammaproteobacteria bacterium]
RYQELAKSKDESSIRLGLDQNSLEILEEYLEHGKAVAEERQRAQAANEAPHFQPLIEKWGGVTVAYRRPMQDSPAYTRNHEEITKALEEGIFYADYLSPLEAKLDQYGQVQSLICQRTALNDDGKLVETDEQVVLPARAILVATGARPNVAYHFEHRGTFEVENMQYRPHVFHNGALKSVPKASHCKDPSFGAFTSYTKDNRHVTFIGDTHPDFNGNVVKAVASGMRIYPKILETFGDRIHVRADTKEYDLFRRHIQDILQPVVKSVTRHTPNIVEVCIRAPQAAKRFHPGQIFRLQNFETLSPVVQGTRLQTETLALTGSKVNSKTGDISLIVRERGGSSRLCATLRPGDPVALMGPGGVRSKIHQNETVMIAGDWLAAIVLRALGPALKQAGSKVLFIGYFPNKQEIFCRDDLEAASDACVWITATGEPTETRRPQDAAATGDFVEIISRYAKGELHQGEPVIPLEHVDALHITGTHCQIRKLRDARNGLLKQYFAKSPATTGSVYSTMQCMLKGVCSQCLQWQVDPKTGKRTKAVFACSWQDEPIDMVDLDALDDRLKQNHLQEHLTNLWLSYLFETNRVPKI